MGAHEPHPTCTRSANAPSIAAGVRPRRAAVGTDGPARRSPERPEPRRGLLRLAVSTKLKVTGVDLAVMGDKDAVRRRRRGRQLQRAVARHLQEADRAQRPAGRRHRPRRRRDRAVAAADVRRPALLLTDNRAELLFPVPQVRHPRRRTQRRTMPDTHADLRLQRRVEGADHRSGAVRRAKCAGRVRRDARVDRLRIVPARSRGDRRARLQGPEKTARPGGLRCRRHRADRRRSEFDPLPSRRLESSRSTRSSGSSRRRTDWTSRPTSTSFARDGWESIGESDRERLKWLGVFFRRQTPGRFMMRIRMPNGFTNADAAADDRRAEPRMRHRVRRHHDAAADSAARISRWAICSTSGSG